MQYIQKGLETSVKDQNNTTSEDYLDNLLNSIMNNATSETSSDSSTDDLGLLGDSLDNIEDELFGSVENADINSIDEDYFAKELSNEELFDLDDDIMSVIDKAPTSKSVDLESENQSDEKIHEIIKDEESDISEVIASNDSVADDNLQGLLDVMGIDEKDSDVSLEVPKKKKKKLFGKKKDKKAGKKASVEESNEMVDLSALAGMVSDESGSVETVENSAPELDLSSLDMGISANNEMSDGTEAPTSDELSMDGLDDFADFGLDFSEGVNDMSASEDVSQDDNMSVSSKYDEEYEEPSEEKKSKKEKKKKEKKPKEKKPKKPKVKKEKKAKKEKVKKEKEPDEVVRVSKWFILLSFTIVFVFICSVILGGDYYTYTKKVSKATKEYVNKNYTVAYDTLFGLEMRKDDDKELFNQIQTVMFVNRHYEAYKNLILMDEYEQGLYSLLKGVKMFDKYQNTGRELNCYDDMQDVLGWIDRGLMETYGLTESQARELNLINNDEKYAVEVCEIAQEAREKAEAEQKAAEEAAKEATKETEKKDKEE